MQGLCRTLLSLGCALLIPSLSACGRVGVDIYAVSDPNPRDSERDAGEPPEVEGDAAREPEDAGVTLADAAELLADAAEPLEDAAEPLDEASVLDAAVDARASDASDAASAEAGAQSTLALRYDFAGSGTMVMDRVGSAHAEILGGAQLDGSGRLTLDGTNDFVNMPNGLLSRYSSVTVMAWVSWGGGPCWQRVFDFGSSNAGEGSAGDATSAFSLSPGSCPNTVVTALFELNGELRAVNGPALTVGSVAQLALVMDGARGVVTLYVNGARANETAVPWQLSQLSDVNNWLGRSQWTQDRFLQASFEEFRIYSVALSATEIAALHTRGANTP